MKQQKLFAAASVGLALVLTTGCGGQVAPAAGNASPASTQLSPPASMRTVDYPVYSTLEELAGYSTAMIRGKVTAVRPSTLNGPGVLQPELRQAGLADWVVTPVEVRVGELLAGSGFNAGSAVTVLQQGGAIGDRKERAPPEEPPLAVGQDVVLFLTSAEGGLPGVNGVIVGGGQGAFLVAAEALQPTRPQPPAGDVDARLKGEKVTTVARQAKPVMGLLRASQTGTTGTTSPTVETTARPS